MSVKLFEVLGRFFRSLRKVARVPGLSGNPVSLWWQRAETEHELRYLSDRDLADIGVARRDICKVARARVNATAEPHKDPTHKRHMSKTVSAEDSFDNVIAFQREDREAADVPQNPRKILRHWVKPLTRYGVHQVEY